MITILGAGGPIGSALGTLLAAKKVPFRFVARDPRPAPGAETFPADLSDAAQTLAAVQGSDIACLVVGLKYDLAVWREMWPRIMRNAIDACKRTGTKLLFFDNVYMYGAVSGPMTELTPYHPCSKKGEVRAGLATMLLDEVKSGILTAMIARSADFYGSKTQNDVPNVLIFEALSKHRTPSWLINDEVPHSLTFIADAAMGIATLIDEPSAWNQVWHLPTAPDPPTGKAFIEMAAEAFGAPAKYRVLNKLMLRAYGLVNSNVRESVEMLYQNERPYIFDSTKFATKFGFAGTTYHDGIRSVAALYK